MILFFLFLLLVFAAGAGAILLLHPDAGYVLISIGPWLVETTLAVLVVGVGVWILLVYLLLRVFGVVVDLPGSVRRAIERRRDTRARQSFEAGLLKLSEGNWALAEIELVRRAADHDSAHLNYLAAARAARRQGAFDRAAHYLQLAMRNGPDHELASLLAGANLARERGDFAGAKAAALQLRQRVPNHPFPVEVLAECYASLGEWEPLRLLLSNPATSGALRPQRRTELMLASLRALMETAVAEARLDRLKALWEASQPYHDDPQLRREYITGLARLNAAPDALALIAQTLAHQWDGTLAQLYGDLHANDPIGQLAAVEQWLAQYGETPELLQVAGRVCLGNRLWGKARSYLEAVVQKAPTPRAYLDLARLCRDTQQPEEAARYYRLGLELAAEPAA
jgi:HemY protein